MAHLDEADGGATDAALMRAVRKGHIEKLGVLFERNGPRVHSLCARITGDAELANDLTQETFLRVLRYGDSFREESSFATWLYRLACNVCHDHLERDRREQPLHESLRLVEESRAPDASTDERHALLEQALARLAPERRTVLVLSRYHDLAYDQIGRILGCSPAAARVRAHRALNELREIYRELEQRGHEVRSGSGIDRGQRLRPPGSA